MGMVENKFRNLYQLVITNGEFSDVTPILTIMFHFLNVVLIVPTTLLNFSIDIFGFSKETFLYFLFSCRKFSLISHPTLI